MTRNTVKTSFIVLLVMLFDSCSVGRIVYSVTRNPVQTKVIQNAKSISIISDICIRYNAIFGGEYIGVSKSLLASSAIAKASQRYLQEAGLKSSIVTLPFVCGFKNPEKLLKSDIDTDDLSIKNFPPFMANSSGQSNIKDQQHMLNVIRWVLSQWDKVGIFLEPSSLGNEMQDSLEFVAKSTGSDVLLILIGDGKYKRQLDTYVIGSPASSSILRPTFIQMWSDRSHLKSFVGLLDLKSKKLVWTTSRLLVNINPGAESDYTRKRVRELLYCLPEKKLNILKRSR